MNPIVRNVIAVLIGWIIGSAVNMGLITIQDSIIPLPEGFDLNKMSETFHLLETKHMIMPFLAHALGTLAGAFSATKIAATHKRNMALIVGVLFMIGGIMMTTMVPSPMWFNIVDVVGAYIPMALLGYYLAK